MFQRRPGGRPPAMQRVEVGLLFFFLWLNDIYFFYIVHRFMFTSLKGALSTFSSNFSEFFLGCAKFLECDNYIQHLSEISSYKSSLEVINTLLLHSKRVSITHPSPRTTRPKKLSCLAVCNCSSDNKPNEVDLSSLGGGNVLPRCISEEHVSFLSGIDDLDGSSSSRQRWRWRQQQW
jgi:hypothetical protein